MQWVLLPRVRAHISEGRLRAETVAGIDGLCHELFAFEKTRRLEGMLRDLSWCCGLRLTEPLVDTPPKLGIFDFSVSSVSQAVREVIRTRAQSLKLRGYPRGRAPEEVVMEAHGPEIRTEAATSLLRCITSDAVFCCVERLREGKPFRVVGMIHGRGPDVDHEDRYCFQVLEPV